MQIRDGFAQDAELVAVAFVIYHGLVLRIRWYESDGITIAIKVLQSGSRRRWGRRRSRRSPRSAAVVPFASAPSKRDAPRHLLDMKRHLFLCQECIVITKKASAQAEAFFVLRRNISVLFGSQAQSIHIYYTAFSNMSRLSASYSFVESFYIFQTWCRQECRYHIGGHSVLLA